MQGQYLPIRHIAVVIPAHNEADSIADCVTAIARASEVLQAYLTKNHFPQLQVTVITVLDSCSDDTQIIMEKLQVEIPNLQYLTCDFRCVGKVRALGVSHAIKEGADWIACTDADSHVSENWLVAQFEHLQVACLKNKPCEMICGVVSVDDWSHLSEITKEKYLAHYQDQMNHRHIHGANLCFSAKCYEKVGGFSDLACHEDVDLVKKFDAQNFNIIWSNQVRVTTSSRLEARAKEGFAHFLADLQQQGS